MKQDDHTTTNVTPFGDPVDPPQKQKPKPVPKKKRRPSPTYIGPDGTMQFPDDVDATPAFTVRGNIPAKAEDRPVTSYTAHGLRDALAGLDLHVRYNDCLLYTSPSPRD